MAELSYQDIQRAVQDATRDMRDGILRLTQHVQRLNNLESQITLMRQEIEGMRRQINATNIQVSNVLARPLVPQERPGIDPHAWQQLGNSIHSINARLIVMQKYLMQVDDYIALANERKREDQEYRTA